MITQKPCKIGYKLVLFIDRLLISTKIGVLKWRWTALWPSLFVISHKTVAFGANCVKFTEARPILSMMEMQPGSLLFGDVWFMGTFAGVCRR